MTKKVVCVWIETTSYKQSFRLIGATYYFSFIVNSHVNHNPMLSNYYVSNNWKIDVKLSYGSFFFDGGCKRLSGVCCSVMSKLKCVKDDGNKTLKSYRCNQNTFTYRQGTDEKDHWCPDDTSLVAGDFRLETFSL